MLMLELVDLQLNLNIQFYKLLKLYYNYFKICYNIVLMNSLFNDIYLYLGTGTKDFNDTYTTGKFLITLYGIF